MDLLGSVSTDTTNLLHFIELEGLPVALLAMVVTWIATKTVTRTFDRLGERATDRRLFFKQVGALVRFALLAVGAVLVVQSVFKVTEQVLLALGGLLVLALGYGFKDLLSSLTAGIILLFDKPFQVGDRVQFGEHYGEIREIGLRSVRMATLDDNLISIPNQAFMNTAVSSANAGALDQMCVFSFYIGCNEDFETAKRVVFEATAASRYVYLNKPIALVMREGAIPDGAERFAISITVKAYVLDGRYETAFGTDIHERVKRAFRRLDIRTAGELEWSGAPVLGGPT